MALQDQIKAAQAEGYNSQEIVQFLSQSNPQVQEAVKEGYQPDEIISFLNQAPSSVLSTAMSGAVKALLPSTATLNVPLTASNKIGNMVQAGGAGLSDLISGKPIQQASTDVTNVEQGQPPTSTAGKVGSLVGSFFTPSQIASTVIGGSLAKPIAAGLGDVGSYVASKVPDITQLAPDVASSIIPKALQAEPEALAALAENPGAISTAQPMASMAEDTGKYLAGIRQQGIKAAKAATEALSDTKPVAGAVDAAQQGLSDLISADVNAPGAKDTVNSIIKSLGKDPSEANVQDSIEKLDELIKYNSTNPTYPNQLLQTIRGDLSNLLKAQNPAYKAGMEASASTRAPLNTLTQGLGVRNGLPADRTIAALSKLNNPDALATQRALDVLPGGTQLAGNAANASAKSALQQSLLGRILLNLVPKANPAIQASIPAIPAATNAASQTLQGLMQ